MKLIFLLMDNLISKIAVFRVQKIHSWSYRSQCSHSFENEDGTTITVTGNAYCTIITDSFMPALHSVNVDDVYVQ